MATKEDTDLNPQKKTKNNKRKRNNEAVDVQSFLEDSDECDISTNNSLSQSQPKKKYVKHNQ